MPTDCSYTAAFSWRWLRSSSGLLLLLAACGGFSEGRTRRVFAGATPGGAVEMRHVQAAFIGIGGTGTPYCQGQSYPFTTDNVYGIGLSTIDANGGVKKLNGLQITIVI